MIKELFLAITLGSILGFGVTGAFFALNKSKVNNKQATIEVSPTPTITEIEMSTKVSVTPTSPISSTKTSIIVNSPENNSVVSNSKITIKGESKANSLILVTTPSKTFNGKSNANGTFNINIELDSGINLIKINSIDAEDNQEQIELNLTYSTAKI